MNGFNDTRYHIRKRNGVYYWKRPHEKTFHTTRTRNKSDARAFIAEALKKDNPIPILLNDYAKDFYVWGECSYIKRQLAKGKSLSEKWAQSRRSHLDMYILPKWGHMRLDQINPVKWENWLISLDLANGTKNSITHTINIIFKEAKREGILKFNQITDVEPLSNNYQNRDAFTRVEIKLMFPDKDEETLRIWGNRYFASLFFTLLTTGMRVGEIIALQWKNVHLDKNAIYVVQAVKNDNTIGTTKNRENRSVLIPDVTKNILAEWKKETYFNADDDFVFHGLDFKNPHKPIHRKTVLDKLKSALTRAGIETEGRTLVVHSFRHTYNTMMRAVISAETLQYMVGHKTAAMTDRYDQATLEDKLQRMLPESEKINDIWRL